jgi:hypothetical protein
MTNHADTIINGLQVFLGEDQFTELRILHPDHEVSSGFFSRHSLDRLATAAIQAESSAMGCYFTPNPVSQSLHRRSADKLTRRPQHALTKDDDITARRWLLIDFDPRRPAKVSSTDDEKETARQVMETCRAGVRQILGATTEVVADSGNGWHLCYRIDAENNEETKSTLKTFLTRLAKTYGTPAVGIDTSIYNAARIWKLYGTLSRKGIATDERPHRRSQIISVTQGEANAAIAEWAAIQRMIEQRPTAATGKTTPDVIARARAYLDKVDPGISGQGGSIPCFRAACILLEGFALTKEEALPLMREYSAKCSPPWSEKELLHKLEDAEKKAVNRGYLLNERPAPTVTPILDEDELPPPVVYHPGEFPLDALPSSLRDLAMSMADAASAPVEFVAGPMLAVAAMAMGYTKTIAITHEWHESSAIYMAIVGDPGSGKSPVLQAIMAPVFAIQREAHKAWEAAKRHAEAEVERWEMEKRQAVKSGGTIPPKPDVPPLMRLVTTDTTVEALAAVLAENPRGIGLYKDELSSLTMGLNQYKAGGKGSDRQFYLSAWSHQSHLCDRKKAGSIPSFVAKPWLTILGGTQPDMLSAMVEDKGREDGFLHRFVWVYPDTSPPAHWRKVAIPDHLRHYWRATVERLWSMAMMQDGEDLRPYVCRLTPGAEAIWERWYNEHADEQASSEFPTEWKSPWSKLRSYMARFALVIHWIRWACDEVAGSDIDEFDMTAGAALVEYFKSGARRVFHAIGAQKADHQADRAYRWVLAHGGSASVRDLMRHKVAGVTTRSAAKQLISDMVERGMGLTKTNKNESGGWPVEVFHAREPVGSKSG